MKTISQHFLETAAKNSSRTSVRYVKGGRWTEMTWKQYLEQVELIAGGLLALGVKAGDRVAVMSNTRYEWAVIDLAILGIGAITIPIYQSSLPEDAKFILNNSEAVAIFCENQPMLSKWKSIAGDCRTVREAVIIDPPSARESVLKWDDLKKKGEDYRRDNPGFFQKTSSSNKVDELATIVYTSGTTGLPKGVMLTHRCIMSEVADVFRVAGITEDDVSLTFLPFAHILARVEHFGHAYQGYTMGYAENIDRLRANLQDIKPTFLIGVPRIFEKIYAGILAQSESSPVKNKIFKWALGVGREVSRAQVARTSPSIKTLIQYQAAKRLVFDKLAQRLGGRLRFAISGSAPLSREIVEFFHAAGLLVLEGYGLTETTGGVFINLPYEYKFGTVGKPIGEVQCKIASDGEILLKSDKVMTGYYKDETATQEVMHDGWFATGDIGELDGEGFLKITDRKKDLIKTAGGKFVAPQKIENLLKLSKYISNVLVHGDKRKYIVTLVTLNYEHVESWARDHGIDYREKTDLASNTQVKALLRDAVNSVNSQLASWESVKNFAILPNDFTIESGELTPSLKVKRKVADKRYADVIESLYGPSDKSAETNA